MSKKMSTTSKIPLQARLRFAAAGHAAKVQALDNGASVEEGHRAYRSAYNTERARFMYIASDVFRRKNLAACRRWRARQAA